jgi:hypothetical protein
MSVAEWFLRGGPARWHEGSPRGGVARANGGSRGGGVAARPCARCVEAARGSWRAEEPRRQPKRGRGRRPYFGRWRRRKKGRGGFVIFQNLRGLTKK